MSGPDVAVIGAGVTGLSVALHLAEAGVRPVVVDLPLHADLRVVSGASAAEPAVLEGGAGTEDGLTFTLQAAKAAGASRVRVRPARRWCGIGHSPSSIRTRGSLASPPSAARRTRCWSFRSEL